MIRNCFVILILLIGAAPFAAADEAPWPHHQRLAADVHVIGFADKYRSANCGLLVADDAVSLVDLPRGIAAADFLAQIKTVTGKPAKTLFLTHATPEDAVLVDELLRQGIERIYLSPAAFKSLTASAASAKANSQPEAAQTSRAGFEIIAERRSIDGVGQPLEFLPLDNFSAPGGAAVFLPKTKVLFGGPAVYHGPRVPLADTDTDAWRANLRQLAALQPEIIVPGFGSWGKSEIIDRQQRFLTELRRQVGYFIAQGQPRDDLQRVVRLVPDYLVWMPYDTPLAEDIEHVYEELTVPHAPFNGHAPLADGGQVHALVLIGDQPHEPGHIEEGLRPVFKATGVAPHFAVDVRALSAENLARVQLLVILRDGLMRPQSAGRPDYVWMTPEQEKAVVDFVHRGGGFLNLHNSMGIYPEDGPYLRLVGGRYIGHGPLERFRVEVVDREHPITRGVENFSVADEQHTPPVDAQRVHLLLRNRSDDGQTAAAGWCYEPGKGRLCHLANGHTREALNHPMYQRLMQNAVRWCAKK
jgi:type 1 glutamine amidotransferase